jgi:exodeoxyribonuclease VII large subunit
VPDVAEQLALVAQHRARARRALTGRLDREWSWLTDVRSRPALADPLQEISRREEAVIALAERARRCFATGLERASDDVGHIQSRLVALSPAATLRRGYAIVQSLDRRVVRRATDVAAGEALVVRFADDQLRVTAERAANMTKDE